MADSTQQSEKERKSSTGFQGEKSDEPIGKRTWEEEHFRNMLLLRQAHEGWMLDKVRKDQQRVAKQQNAMLRQQLGGSWQDEEGADDEMGVNVGNQYHFHSSSEQTPQPAQVPSAPSVNSKSKSWLPAVLTGLAMLGGAGGGALGTYLLTRPNPSYEDTDTDNITEVRPGFGQPENVERQ